MTLEKMTMTATKRRKNVEANLIEVKKVSFPPTFIFAARTKKTYRRKRRDIPLDARKAIGRNLLLLVKIRNKQIAVPTTKTNPMTITSVREKKSVGLRFFIFEKTPART